MPQTLTIFFLFDPLMAHRALNFAIVIVLRSFDEMAIADRDLDHEKKTAIAIDDQKIADHSYLAYFLVI